MWSGTPSAAGWISKGKNVTDVATISAGNSRYEDPRLLHYIDVIRIWHDREDTDATCPSEAKSFCVSLRKSFDEVVSV